MPQRLIDTGFFDKDSVSFFTELPQLVFGGVAKK